MVGELLVFRLTKSKAAHPSRVLYLVGGSMWAQQYFLQSRLWIVFFILLRFQYHTIYSEIQGISASAIQGTCCVLLLLRVNPEWSAPRRRKSIKLSDID